ncbi:MAG: hypothetical protein KM312_03865 [Hydrogenibacillus schlegelii]|uniref:Uncharacterized protein n=1 Tax=Hydrogenibacillus schlegelii TaxID=1484 RepID=A0A947GH09_HYDSH|nr:hypothetical protein [Hydrogenibacillus schlegelii]
MATVVIGLTLSRSSLAYGVAGVLAVVLSARLAEAKPGAPPLERLADGAALFAVWLALNVQPGRTPAELALTFGACHADRLLGGAPPAAPA